MSMQNFIVIKWKCSTSVCVGALSLYLESVTVIFFCRLLCVVDVFYCLNILPNVISKDFKASQRHTNLKFTIRNLV